MRLDARAAVETDDVKWYIHWRSMNSLTHCGWLRGLPRYSQFKYLIFIQYLLTFVKFITLFVCSMINLHNYTTVNRCDQRMPNMETDFKWQFEYSLHSLLTCLCVKTGSCCYVRTTLPWSSVDHWSMNAAAYISAAYTGWHDWATFTAAENVTTDDADLPSQ